MERVSEALKMLSDNGYVENDKLSDGIERVFENGSHVIAFQSRFDASNNERVVGKVVACAIPEYTSMGYNLPVHSVVQGLQLNAPLGKEAPCERLFVGGYRE